MTYQELMAEGRRILEVTGIPDAEVDSFLLLEHVAGMTRSAFYLRSGETVPDAEVLRYRSLVEERKRHIPLQHITGEQEFMGFPFYVNENVLVPRQDTECLVELALEHVRGKRVLDMCTGSGCIAVSLMLLGEPSVCHAVDVSEAALETARKNAKRNHAEILLIKSNLFDKITECYDIIVSNPPYIAPEEIEELSEEVREHEPRLALDGGEEGLYFYRRISRECRKYLTEDGMLFFEIGCEQAEAVMKIMCDAGFAEVTCRKDYAGNDRVVFGKMEAKNV